MVQGARIQGNGEGLPARRTLFVGRAAAVSELVDLVERKQLVTLVGAPGCGKTRLGIEVAAQVAPGLDGGVKLVELAPVTHRDSVAHAVAAALEISEEPGRPMLDVLVDGLADAEPMLVVLDNCEHLVDRVAALVERLLTACPAVSVLATSRAVIGVPAELAWAVPPLPLESAVELFVDRAELVSGRPRLTQGDSALIERICLGLDCVPLAIEITAAWSRVLSPGQILDRLTGPSPRSATVVPASGRHHGSRYDTMSAAVDWSYQLLPEGAQRVFRELSVFAGTFDVDALDAIVGSAGDALGWLTLLVDNSLVLAERAGAGPMRYRLLEPVRQYAEALLEASGESDTIRARHAGYYRELAERYDPWGLWVRGLPIRLEELALDDDNLLAAFEWARRQPSDLCLRLAVASVLYWAYGGRVNDGRLWLEEILAKGTDDERLRDEALAGIGLLAWRHGDYDQALARLGEVVEHGGTGEDPLLYARVLLRLVPVEFSAGKLEEATRHSHEAIDAYHAFAGDAGTRSPSVVLGVATALLNLGWTCYVDGGTEKGNEYMRAALEANRPFGNASVTSYGHLGMAYGALLVGDAAAQRVHLTAAVAGMNDGGIIERSDWLWMAAGLAALQGRSSSAMRLIGGATTSARRRGSSPPSRLAAPVASVIERAVQDVNPALSDALVSRGQEMTWDELVAEALAEPDVGGPLTRREHEVAVLVAEGLTNAGIAERLVISRRTVESHVDHTKRKLGFRSRNEIIVWMVRSSEASSSQDP